MTFWNLGPVQCLGTQVPPNKQTSIEQRNKKKSDRRIQLWIDKHNEIEEKQDMLLKKKIWAHLGDHMPQTTNNFSKLSLLNVGFVNWGDCIPKKRESNHRLLHGLMLLNQLSWAAQNTFLALNPFPFLGGSQTGANSNCIICSCPFVGSRPNWKLSPFASTDYSRLRDKNNLGASFTAFEGGGATSSFFFPA